MNEEKVEPYCSCGCTNFQDNSEICVCCGEKLTQYQTYRWEQGE